MQENRPSKSSARVTIADVAKRANVSISTVSHAYSNRRPISEAVKSRIFQVAEQLCYRPHSGAQALAKKKTMTIGVIARDMLDQWAAPLIQEIQQCADQYGYRISLGLTGDSTEKAQEYVNGCINGQADGIILLTYNVDEEMVQRIVDTGFPITTILAEKRIYDDIRQTIVKKTHAFRRMLDTLYALGHRTFGRLWFRGDSRYPVFEAFCQDMQIPFDSSYEVRDVRTMAEAEVAVQTLLRRRPDITALVCYNDILAIGALRAAVELGIKVPDQLSVVGNGDTELGRVCHPALTTLQYPIKDMCQEAILRLINKINQGPEMPIRTFPVELISRESTGPAPNSH